MKSSAMRFVPRFSTLKPFLFNTATLTVVTIGAGGTVTWSWSTGEAHNVAGNGFSSNVSETGSFSFTFGAPGSYSFTCEVHPLTMNGTVNVQ